jgi:hypothetical protein
VKRVTQTRLLVVTFSDVCTHFKESKEINSKTVLNPELNIAHPPHKQFADKMDRFKKRGFKEQRRK